MEPTSLGSLVLPEVLPRIPSDNLTFSTAIKILDTIRAIKASLTKFNDVCAKTSTTTTTKNFK